MGNGYWEAKTVNQVLESPDRCHNGKYFGLGQEKGDGKTSTGGRSTGDLSLLFFLSTLLVPLPWTLLFAPLTAHLGHGARGEVNY